MNYVSQIVFALILIAGIGYFAANIKRLVRNIRLGRDIDRTDRKAERWKIMTLVAFGQQKMVVRPIAGILHIIVYVGFIIINIEVIEIIIDGLFGTHRVLSAMGILYDFLIGSFEILALLVIVAVVLFWIRRNILKLKRFFFSEMKGWPKSDANIILYFEVILMVLFLTMNAADYSLQQLGSEHYHQAGAFPISQYLSNLITPLGESSLIIIERSAWWLHIVGILIFLNYLYYSKHLHILLAFPNTWFSDLNPQGQMNNMESVTNEVKLMMDPEADPYAMPDQDDDQETAKFGASDVSDLNWVQLMNAYSCTECGRCTSECPASRTGKKLSPRKIMMDTRDRLEEVGRNIDANKGVFKEDGKQLLDDYITREELWACTTCNACVEACPVNISPLSIIVDMRRYLVMEQSAAPMELNNMMTNIENNAAPWPYNQMDRLNWRNE
ncbi:(Fe-S)-binding protein [Galbibacter sp.]|uniref:(Fe-S)-binding protein n=1 Tax=Galbibacter sp. TaxID=2918471 RepID=UPI002B84F014|nr:(Fe-S)-binding protein [Galbibacter sp.]HLV63070.1 (Fe-S)-binding protein [Galbibacter sp.]